KAKGWRQAQSAKLIKGIIEGKTQKEIAESEGVTQRAITYRTQWPEYKEMLVQFSNDLRELAMQRIDELCKSEDPLDKRTGAGLTVAMLKIFPPPRVTQEVTMSYREESRVQRDNLTPDDDEKLKELILKMDGQP
ncbi:hypothetical protein MEO43_31275, partial [Dolichospermum sp. ST_sed5]|nr:hypothetical protein [Dolichospermum sp. ST_sed5]